MGRISRLKAGRGVYHIYNRALNSTWILASPEERDRFLKILSYHIKRYPILVYHYCIMSDHFHLVLDGDIHDISNFIAGCSSTYSKSWHFYHGGNGPLWQGRFKSILVQKELYLNRLGRYVEQNPLRAGMDSLVKAEDYKWSSAAAYVSGTPDFLVEPEKHPYRLNWGTSSGECGKNYAEYLKLPDPDDSPLFRGIASCLGDEKFKASQAFSNGRIYIRSGRPSGTNINISNL